MSRTELILQPLRHFTYVATHSQTLASLYLRHSSTFPSLHLRHNSFSNPSVALHTSQLILQPFRRFTYVTAHSPTLPLLHLRHSSFYNPSFASSTSQALHLIHLASRPCFHPTLVERKTKKICSKNLTHQKLNQSKIAMIKTVIGLEN